MQRWGQRRGRYSHQSRSTEDCWQARHQAKGWEQILPQVSQEETTRLTPWLRTSGLQKREEHISVVLSHPVCGPLLRAALGLARENHVASREIRSIYNYANTKHKPPDRCLYSFCWSSKHFCTEPKNNPCSLESDTIKVTYSPPVASRHCWSRVGQARGPTSKTRTIQPNNLMDNKKETPSQHENKSLEDGFKPNGK